ncbi:hypothetical protein HMPREF3156_00226 [Neisseria sp. HMSC06F02]|nr:hypothetical protein HMPREF3156_00226 [Neisseria sp. HMSC06F02]
MEIRKGKCFKNSCRNTTETFAKNPFSPATENPCLGFGCQGKKNFAKIGLCFN